jgi:hypothetical protein
MPARPRLLRALPHRKSLGSKRAGKLSERCADE